MSNSFNVAKKEAGEIVILELEGYLDAHTAPEFEEEIQKEIVTGNHRLLVDCSRLEYISSAGLGVFMGFVEEVREQGGDIKICAPVRNVRQVFEMLGFHQLFHITDDRESGIQKFQEQPVWEG